ncbi:DUF445 domain-containing protein [Lapillicoccus jejuensis]|uniref:Uncharacterized membrane-anchored protein YjiN (DUF445 family) n=1 Tax=Lapillicoccus jejuensis TaxID=402171 RepID=A0A542E6N3_9MICO|nr:DUF445 domain-containing protein [Lapillicoccus jejuensis]TQJ10995.1 uncharacterized membrane-anchored protein YjiN (DUF445 family) [Lapillicoccus jejuensis]
MSGRAPAPAVLGLAIASDPEADAARLRGLRQMRLVALGLLVLAAVVFVLTLHAPEASFWGFVHTGAEASMVGAMADWFAVTALFRHPLGLPIPHTALIPRRKDMLARSLQDFLGENFLREEIIRERVLTAQVSARVSRWLLEPGNTRRAVDEAAGVLSAGLQRLRDESVGELVQEAVLPRLREEAVSPIAGSLLGEVVRDKAHYGLVDLALDEAHRWLRENKATFATVLQDRAPTWVPQLVNDLVIGRAHTEALRWVSDIRTDPEHDVRRALDDLLAQLSHDLLHDEATMERAERLKQRVLDHPQVLETALSLWRAFRRTLLAALADADGPLRTRAREEVARLARQVQDDAALRDRLDGHLADLAVFAVDRYGQELTDVVSSTIDRWDGDETARRVELFVGRDLQFIRINGTVVGGVVGLIIHAVAVLAA